MDIRLLEVLVKDTKVDDSVVSDDVRDALGGEGCMAAAVVCSSSKGGDDF